ncbi:hypothetical protein PWG71_10765 [Nocardiopsis sp. N85]|uniref:hypothetical protein n=1 Tax=Nocardiopsis sp. N85 TaxID=3029400 RepID=UPI00237F458F|nr:hypothetical protein [Nocardiopsis sp. N85]MDE3721870.1 hypothetical protein [Nocardiopsis sp. N85]
MKILRSHHTEHFTVLPNAALRDPRLSWAARGLLAELLSRPRNWWTDADAMTRLAKRQRGENGESRQKTRSLFRELESTGYLARSKTQRPDGTWSTALTLHDLPRNEVTPPAPPTPNEHPPSSDRGTENRPPVDRTSDSRPSSVSNDQRNNEDENPSVRKPVTTEATPTPTPAPAHPAEPAAPALPNWALDLLKAIPDGALRHPARDRLTLARRLASLHLAGLTQEELTHALTGWEETLAPFAALSTRLASPETVRAWNTRAPTPGPTSRGFERNLFGGVPMDRLTAHADTGDPAPPGFTLDSRGRATGTCPDHPTVRNVPGGACTVCGHVCRTHPSEPVHPPADRIGPPPPERIDPPATAPEIPLPSRPPTGTDASFAHPKCDDQHCNADRTSPRYRMVLRIAPTGRDVIAVPCPTCGERADRTAPAAAPVAA